LSGPMINNIGRQYEYMHVSSEYPPPVKGDCCVLQS
jgi:hypothetical protein